MSGVCGVCGASTYDEEAACPHCGDQVGGGSAASSGAVARSREQGRVPENIAAVLAYVTVIPAIVLLFTKPYSKNEFVRFHALQSVAVAAASIALAVTFLVLANIAAINLLLIPVSLIAAMGIALVVIVCMLKAYQQERYPLPLLGAWAKKQSLRS